MIIKCWSILNCHPLIIPHLLWLQINADQCSNFIISYYNTKSLYTHGLFDCTCLSFGRLKSWKKVLHCNLLQNWALSYTDYTDFCMLPIWLTGILEDSKAVRTATAICCRWVQIELTSIAGTKPLQKWVACLSFGELGFDFHCTVLWATCTYKTKASAGTRMYRLLLLRAGLKLWDWKEVH